MDSLNRGDRAESTGRIRLLEFKGQSTQEERLAQKQNPGCLQRISSIIWQKKYSACM